MIEMKKGHTTLNIWCDACGEPMVSRSGDPATIDFDGIAKSTGYTVTIRMNSPTFGGVGTSTSNIKLVCVQCAEEIYKILQIKVG